MFVRKKVELENVGMVSGIMGKVWEKEEMRIGMIEVEVWRGDIIMIEIEIRDEEWVEVWVRVNGMREG